VETEAVLSFSCSLLLLLLLDKEFLEGFYSYAGRSEFSISRFAKEIGSLFIMVNTVDTLVLLPLIF
jgi:hypothetical protein